MKLLTVAAVVIALCYVGEVRAGTSTSNSASDVKVNVDITADFAGELKEQLKKRKGTGGRRTRRSPAPEIDWTGGIHKFTEAADLYMKRVKAFTSLLTNRHDSKKVIEASKTLTGYSNPAVRPFAVTTNPLLKTLNGALSQYFLKLWQDNPKNVGDIISCRVFGSDLAEHYILVLNKTHVLEVGVPDGTILKSDEGAVMVRPVQRSAYYSSEQCLYHNNTVIEAAINCDKMTKGKKAEEDTEFYEERAQIHERILPLLKKLDYNLLYCNCQDLTLYWAYGLVSNRQCFYQFYPDKIIVGERSIQEVEDHVASQNKKCMDKKSGN